MSFISTKSINHLSKLISCDFEHNILIIPLILVACITMSFLILIPSAVYAESEINCEDRGKKFDVYAIESKANG